MLIPVNILYYAQYNIERIFMNYCVYLRKRRNKPFCKLLNKEIPFCRCQQCGSKEYKSNVNQIKKKSTLKEKSPLKSGKMKNKSNKLAKLERNRKSVFTNNMDKCYLCSNKRTDIHEIFRGRNRKNSMIYGFVLPLCRECHSTKAETADFEEFWHRKAQIYFEEHLGTREDFIKIFRRNYIIKKRGSR